MKKLLLIFISFALAFSCSEKEDESSNNVDSNLIVYKNQTGNVNADALQAQYKDSQGVLNFYGNFDEESNPTIIRTLTYQKTNNDTIVNLIIDPLTSRVASSYTSVNGVKSDIVIKFDYPDNTHMSVSFHQYNWNNNSSEIIYGVNLKTANGISSKLINTKKSAVLGSSGDGAWKIGALGVGLVVAEVVGTVGGGFTLGLITGVSTVAAAAVAFPLLAVSAAIIAASVILSDSANASELAPTNLPYPDDTPVVNPVTEEEDPTPNLSPFDCSGTFISFKPVMYQDGTIVIEDISGGVAPYIYLVETEVKNHQIFPNDYEDGGYEVCLKDADGCITCSYSLLERPKNCDNTTLSVTTTATSNSATATATGGQAPYAYLWSNGSTSSIASNLIEGTYTVFVTDQLGCTSSAEAVIVSSSSYADLIIGTWKETGFTTNGVDEFDSSDCDIIVTFTETQIISTEYYGNNPGECNLLDSSTSNYSIAGNIITEAGENGEPLTIEILELNETTLIVKETEPNYIFIQTFSKQ